MLNILNNNKTKHNLRQLILAFVLIAGFVGFLCLFFDPRWETNDDVGMSMVAHGYGLATGGMPNLIFSNILWGYLVRAIPTVGGVFGYSIATLAVIVTVGAVVLYGLRQLGVTLLTATATTVLILVRPTLFPQFTLNAGLLLVSAVICWRMSARRNSFSALYAASLLAFLSYLVRDQEFFLVFFVALPLLPWNLMLKQRRGQVAVSILILAVVTAAVLDHRAYQTEEWTAFNALNPIRALFTDFGVGTNLALRPDILARHGYSINDVNLISSWFFVDPKIANPQALNAMVRELGPLRSESNITGNVWTGLQALVDPHIFPLILAALCLTALRPSRQLFITWVLFVSAIVALSLLGRPGVLRVYVPMVSLLITAPLLDGKSSKFRDRIVFCVLLLITTFNAANVFSESKIVQQSDRQIRRDLSDFPQKSVVLWGGLFPFEAVYPVLSASTSTKSYRLYGLGVFTLAPFSVAYSEQRLGQGMTDLLMENSGVLIVANDQTLKYLGIYCKEHHNGKLKELYSHKYGSVELSSQRCELNTDVTQVQKDLRSSVRPK